MPEWLWTAIPIATGVLLTIPALTHEARKRRRQRLEWPQYRRELR